MATMMKIALSGLVIVATILVQIKSEQVCVPLTNAYCGKAGYSLTANFPAIDGQPYQAAKGAELQTYLALLGCSPVYSQTILCSLHFPKCDPNMDGPHLPCRSVCNEFVNKCGSVLDLAATKGILAVLCDLLPEHDGNNRTCFLPEGFNISAAAPGVKKDQCYNISDQKCADDLHYNATFYDAAAQASSAGHILQPVIATNCSSKLEKFTCFSRVPPCVSDNNSIQVPCQSLCKNVSKDCASELSHAGIPLPDCEVFYPNGTGINDMCNISKWPAPWTNGTHVIPSVAPTTSKPVTGQTSTPLPPTTKPVSKHCSPLTIKSCADAGYTNTFRYPNIQGKPYQMMKSSHLEFYMPMLRSCSKLASMILCSMYAPRCDDEHYPKPVLPCRRVCYQFIKECHSHVRFASVYGMFVSVCDLLPIKNEPGTPCFEPPNFKSSAGGTSKDVCHPVITKSKCIDHLHYNASFIDKQEQAHGQFHLMQSIIDTKCSPDIERFFCYMQLPPCNSEDDVSVQLPCRPLCEKVVRECGHEYEKRGWKAPDCDFLLPNVTGVNGLCRIRKFPVPDRIISSIEPTTPPRRKKNKSHKGVIIGIVVTLLLVIIAGALVFVYFRFYRNRNPFSPQVFHNVQTAETYET